jgi:Flp pilus assembly protein TadG
VFWKDKSGNFGVVTALLVVPLFACAGLAVDFSKAMVSKAELQSAADSAVLSAVSMAKTSNETMKAELTKVFKGNLSPALAGSASVEDINISADNYITINAQSSIPLTLGAFFFKDSWQLKVAAQAVRSDYQKVEIAMVLDNTYSMTGQKLTNLKAAANALLDVFEKSKNQNVRFALVPFSRYVNVGTANRNQLWLTVPDDYSTTKNTCTTSKPVVSKSGCKTVTTTGTNDGVQTTSTREQCDSYTYGEPVTSCSDKTSTYTWTGCVGSRNSPLDVNDTEPTLRYTGLLNTSCGSAVVPLTTNYSTLRTAISKMVANNETYIPAGVLWGWNMLSPTQPFTEGEPKATGINKFLIIMTDGTNTLSPNKSNYMLHTGTDTAKADSLMTTVCSNAKNAGLTIYTVAVGVTGSTAEGLATCANDSSKAFSIEDSAKLVEVFKKIAGQILTPRLTM